MLIGLDSKALQSLGLDPKIVASLLEQQNPAKSGAGSSSKPPKTISTAKISSSVTPTFSSLESRVSTTAGAGSSNSASTAQASLDAAAKMYGGIDPKLLAGMDPKLLGLDAKTAAAYGLDPKMLDPKMFAGGIDPKMFGLDPKLFAGLDAKTLAAYGIDPKFVQDAAKTPDKTKAPVPPTSSAASAAASASAAAAAAAMNPLAGLDPKLLGLD